MFVFVIGALLKALLLFLAVLAMAGRHWAIVALIVMLALMILFDVVVVVAGTRNGKDIGRWSL